LQSASAMRVAARAGGVLGRGVNAAAQKRLQGAARRLLPRALAGG
jgi:hypothetical protein